MQGGVMVILVLILWVILCGLSTPSMNEIKRACAGHGNVISYESGGMLEYSKGAVVCQDGTVKKS